MIPYRKILVSSSSFLGLKSALQELISAFSSPKSAFSGLKLAISGPYSAISGLILTLFDQKSVLTGLNQLSQALPVTQGQYVVSDIRCPAFWAAALKGMKSCRTQGDFRLFILLSFRSSIPPTSGLSGLKSGLSGLKSGLSGLKLSL